MTYYPLDPNVAPASDAQVAAARFAQARFNQRPIAVQVEGHPPQPQPIEIAQGDNTPPARYAYAATGDGRTYQEPEPVTSPPRAWLMPALLGFGVTSVAGAFVFGIVVGGAWYGQQLEAAQRETRLAQEQLESLQLATGELCRQIPAHIRNAAPVPSPPPAALPKPAIADAGENASAPKN